VTVIHRDGMMPPIVERHRIDWPAVAQWLAEWGFFVAIVGAVVWRISS